MCYCLEKAKLTWVRVAELQKWLTAQEGNVCNGSKGQKEAPNQ